MSQAPKSNSSITFQEHTENIYTSFSIKTTQYFHNIGHPDAENFLWITLSFSLVFDIKINYSDYFETVTKEALNRKYKHNQWSRRQSALK